ncbi:MAG: hypothetical protein ACI85Q_001696 [Salibacteraceae bacterium]|jgi:hypothetical protein
MAIGNHCYLKLPNLSNLPNRFDEYMIYNMIGYMVPLKIYSPSDHMNSTLSLPFIHIASQKNITTSCHSLVYASPELLNEFISTYSSHVKMKLDLGKSGIRLKKVTHIPYDVIRELTTKLSVEDWVKIYKKQ